MKFIKLLKSAPLALILCSLLGINSAAEASDKHADDKLELTPKQAASQAIQLYGGEVMSITDKKHYYKVKLLKEGRIKTVSIPPQGEAKNSAHKKNKKDK